MILNRCSDNVHYRSLDVDGVSHSNLEDIGNKVILHTGVHLDNVATLSTNIEIVDGDSF